MPRRSAIDKDDLRQEGIIALIQAVDQWSEETGCAFSTYALPRILRRVRWAANLEWRSQGHRCSVISAEELETPMDEFICDPDAERGFGRIVVNAMLDAALDDRECEVVKRYLGLCGYLPRTQQEIGLSLRLSDSMVNKIYRRAIGKLKKAFGAE